ncbi:MAG TPA: serine/threonine-protein kinase [Myxococcaceae bacterium]|nr:serine/threonine-protein kinase [Myxococcaceae bacterium]
MTTATRASLNRDTVSGEALFILKNLKDNSKQGRSNKLAEVKTALEPAVSLEFDAYFFFLRKFHYIAMDREAQLKLTDSGERVVDGADLDRFSGEVGEFFSEQLAPVDEPISDGALPFDTDNVTDDLSVETADLTPPPTPAPAAAPRPLRRASAPAEAAADLDGRYSKGEAIGGGPLGAVHRGRHVALGTEVCIKELKDIFGYFSFLQRGEVLKRLKRELCAQAQVRHPAVVSILDQSIEGARAYVVMELLAGSLRDRLERAGGKSLPVGESIRTFLQLSYALRAAHASGLTHHNLKPENVLYDGYGNARLGDFGLSRVIEVEPGKGLPQVFVGTNSLSYLAPELITRKDAGPAADVYGLGILLYEMLTGSIPGRRSPLPSEVNSEVPSKLDPIFDKMTQDRRDSRYPDFDAMLDEFYGAFSDGEFLHRGDLVLSSEPPGA